MMKTADFNSPLDLHARRDREEIMNEIYRLVGQQVGKVIATFDPMAINIVIFPRVGETFNIGRPIYGNIRNHGEYEEE